MMAWVLLRHMHNPASQTSGRRAALSFLWILTQLWPRRSWVASPFWPSLTPIVLSGRPAVVWGLWTGQSSLPRVGTRIKSNHERELALNSIEIWIWLYMLGPRLLTLGILSLDIGHTIPQKHQYIIPKICAHYTTRIWVNYTLKKTC